MQDPHKLEVRPAIAQENTSASGVDFSKPFTSGQGKFIGRVIVEQFESADPRDDGIHFRISFPASANGDVIRKYGQELVRKLAARLDRG
jgi:hypothetical protein